MPSKNSINRPKDTTHQNRKIKQLAKKRQDREQKGLLAPSRSSENSRSGQAKSLAYDIYKGAYTADDGNAVTNRTLSKKRTKKIERNLKYLEQRKLLIDLQSQNESKDSGMSIDQVSVVSSSTKKQGKPLTELGKVRSSMWEAIDEQKSTGLVLENGTGTTLGSQFFS